MTATERLRQLLDERGVEWIDFDGEPTWMGNDRMHYARQECSCDEPTDEVTVYHLTPEQAIDATLVRGTCRRVLYKPTGVLVCSECGAGMPRQLDKYCYLHFCPNCGRRVIGEEDE